VAGEASVNNFIGPLIAEQLDGGYRWRIHQSFTYRIGDANSPHLVRVPEGFITDFASIPRGLWNLWPPAAGKHSKAAVVHDVCYVRGYIESDLKHKKITRKDADDIFKEALDVAGCSWFTRQALYWGVRVGGSQAWDNYRWVDTDVESTR
jgi:hypothetical protein